MALAWQREPAGQQELAVDQAARAAVANACCISTITARQSRCGSLASLNKLDDLAGETVALPFVRGPQNLHGVIVGAPHCFHEIENVRGHQHFDLTSNAPALLLSGYQASSASGRWSRARL
jgi:hypothetical protein